MFLESMNCQIADLHGFRTECEHVNTNNKNWDEEVERWERERKKLRKLCTQY